MVLEKLASIKNSADFWATIKKYKKRPVSSAISINMETWNSYYNLITPPKKQDDTTFFGVLDLSLDLDFTMEELNTALKHSKPNKAAGPDKMKNEFCKSLPSNWKYYFLCLFNKVLDTETIPSNWFSTLITMIHKKGDHSDPSNYRGIALVNHITKVFTYMLNKRLEKWARETGTIPEAQAGFQAKKGCMDNLFNLLSAINIQLRQPLAKLFILFVDFRRAFDSINHQLLWMKLHNLGVSAKLVRLLRKMYSFATFKVQSNGITSKEFEVGEGVLQGEILSPLLFILFISDLEEFFRNNGCLGINIDGRNDILSLLYADDLALLAYSKADLQKILNLLMQYCQANKLTVNANKTKIISRLPRDLNFFYGEQKN